MTTVLKENVHVFGGRCRGRVVLASLDVFIGGISHVRRGLGLVSSMQIPSFTVFHTS